jgi:hypothetical protein
MGRGYSMVKCKYYVNGICYSPYTIKTFGGPSAEPVDPSYCLTERYKECKYYVENSKNSTEELDEALLDTNIMKFYPKIHLIPCDMTSQCPFFEVKVVDKEKGLCIAKCTIFDKYLTRSSVRKCIEYWKECPFYKIGLQVTA